VIRMNDPDGGHESRGSGPIYTLAAHPQSVHTSFSLAHSLSSVPPLELRDLRRATARNPSPLVAFPPEQFTQAQSTFRSGNQSPSSTTMNSGSPSRHPSNAEEEDSPLQQSAHTSHPPMVDSYPEDITSKTEEEIAGQTTEEAAEEEIDGGFRHRMERILVLHGGSARAISSLRPSSFREYSSTAPRLMEAHQ
jgi:hypothetical protein